MFEQLLFITLALQDIIEILFGVYPLKVLYLSIVGELSDGHFELFLNSGIPNAGQVSGTIIDFLLSLNSKSFILDLERALSIIGLILL